MKKILVPTDFSKPATEAFKFALDLGETTGMDIIVVHALSLPVVAAGFDVQPYVYSPELIDQLESVARESFKRMVSRHPSPVKSTLEIRYNSVLDSVLDVISKGNIEIVIMGTKGSDGLEEILVGSNTEKVVRFSGVPVIAIRNAPSVKGIANIVFPNNLALNQHKLIERVKNLQSFFNAKLHVLWINTPARFVVESEIHGKLRDFVEYYGLSNYTLTIRNDIDEATGIAAFARETKADMIAMGTRGRTGLVHLFTGSIAEDVVNHIDCPVWTYSTHK